MRVDGGHPGINLFGDPRSLRGPSQGRRGRDGVDDGVGDVDGDREGDGVEGNIWPAPPTNAGAPRSTSPSSATR